MAEGVYQDTKTDQYYETKRQVLAALIEIIDVSQLTNMDEAQARDEIKKVVNEIVEQSIRTGGNLAEALSNLSKLLRGRKRMQISRRLRLAAMPGRAHDDPYQHVVIRNKLPE